MKGRPVARAQAALDTYATSSQSSYRDNPEVAAAVVRFLVRDLAVYALQHRLAVDTTRLLEVAENRSAPPATQRTAFDIGAEVKVHGAYDKTTTRTPGYVTAVRMGKDGDQRYEVTFPGAEPRETELPASALMEWSPFGEVKVSGGTLSGALAADQQYLRVADRICATCRIGDAPASDDLAELSRLAEALTAWTGVPAEKLWPFEHLPAAVSIRAQETSAQLAAHDSPSGASPTKPAATKASAEAASSGRAKSAKRTSSRRAGGKR
ncbi:hypothetical protein [Actinomadura rupiterrae]|uniref:hypothetical protein n=1 Tax=Actinomadura rupiterrae TaxID=559627 RepID=UPI0020A2CC94|nr:hypothetical protein [Actinomadura rupiterrae]MCP2337925.1 hypothetical protein [Actinomadura rupiterrae]